MSDEIFPDIASGIFRLVWGKTSLTNGIIKGNERLHSRVMAVLEYKAPQVESHMKTNARWTDQTGNARNGLRAEAFDEGDSMGIVLYHTAPYGVWLELAHSGKYGIINDSISIMGPEVMRSIERVLERI